MFVVLQTPAALTTSSHTFTNSLSQPRNPHLRRILRCTGWRGQRCDDGLPRGPSTFNFDLWLMVPSTTWLEWALVPRSDRVWAALLYSLCVYGLPPVGH